MKFKSLHLLAFTIYSSFSTITYNNSQLKHLVNDYDDVSWFSIYNTIYDSNKIMNDIINAKFLKLNRRDGFSIQNEELDNDMQIWFTLYVDTIEFLIMKNNYMYDYWQHKLSVFIFASDLLLINRLTDHFIFLMLHMNTIESITDYFFNSIGHIDYVMFFFVEMMTFDDSNILRSSFNNLKENMKLRDYGQALKTFKMNKKSVIERLNPYSAITIHLYYFMISNKRYIIVRLSKYLYEFVIVYLKSKEYFLSSDITLISYYGNIQNLFECKKSVTNIEEVKRSISQLKILMDKCGNRFYYNSFNICSDHWIKRLLNDELKNSYLLSDKLKIIETFKLLRADKAHLNIENIQLLMQFFNNEIEIRKNMLISMASNEKVFYSYIIEIYYNSSESLINEPENKFYEYITSGLSNTIKKELINLLDEFCINKLKKPLIKFDSNNLNTSKVFLYELIFLRLITTNQIVEELRTQNMKFKQFNEIYFHKILMGDFNDTYLKLGFLICLIETKMVKSYTKNFPLFMKSGFIIEMMKDYNQLYYSMFIAHF
ncbi:hypothetical protein TCON_2632 [Astathelohania contejeani]|uniref:Uncharacterized protein n=1 Tax=Astathelohania contejeani TaxID=164912 RepID=A0ABQ7HVH5_9MICR|nr:hypothetical protein TCON_2632 [Thelohania contejeani]